MAGAAVVAAGAASGVCGHNSHARCERAQHAENDDDLPQLIHLFSFPSSKVCRIRTHLTVAGITSIHEQHRAECLGRPDKAGRSQDRLRVLWKRVKPVALTDANTSINAVARRKVRNDEQRRGVAAALSAGRR
jgi:hypothetical protein